MTDLSTTSSVLQRVLLTAGLIGLTAAALGSSALAAFTGSTGSFATSASGSVALAPVAADGPGNRLSVAASDLAPGDTAERAVTLRNDGSVDLDPASVRLTTSSPVPSPLVADPVDGLQVTVDRCPVPWDEAGTPPAYTYTCAGAVTTALAGRPVLGAEVPLVGLDGAAGASNHLRVTLSLPATASDDMQGAAAGIDWSFSAAQRATGDR